MADALFYSAAQITELPTDGVLSARLAQEEAMRLSRTLRRGQITRRMVLGGAATMAVAPALAEECSLGPPPHEKGPTVFMDYDQFELDAAYDQSFYAPLAGQIWKRLAAVSEAVRGRLGQPLRESWADRDRAARHLPRDAS